MSSSHEKCPATFTCIVCPMCRCNMSIHAKTDLDYHECDNAFCRYKGLARYSIYINRAGKTLSEQILLTDHLYVTISFIQDQTVISRLNDELAETDKVLLHKALTLNLQDIPGAIQKIKTLLLFS